MKYGPLYSEMLKQCPLRNCKGKPMEMQRTENRKRFKCDVCLSKFRMAYRPYLVRIANEDYK